MEIINKPFGGKMEINKYDTIGFHFEGQYCRATINKKTLNIMKVMCDGIELVLTDDIINAIHKYMGLTT